MRIGNITDGWAARDGVTDGPGRVAHGPQHSRTYECARAKNARPKSRASEVRQPSAGLEHTGVMPHGSRDGVANVFQRILRFLQEPQRLVSPMTLIFAAGNSLARALKPAIRCLLAHDCNVEYDRGDCYRNQRQTKIAS